jgi:hypothetical protein
MLIHSYDFKFGIERCGSVGSRARRLYREGLLRFQRATRADSCTGSVSFRRRDFEASIEVDQLDPMRADEFAAAIYRAKPSRLDNLIELEGDSGIVVAGIDPAKNKQPYSRAHSDTAADALNL